MPTKINVTKSSLPSFSEYCDTIESIWNSHWLTNMGPLHEALRNDLLAYLDVSNIDLLTNGHMALELSLQALQLEGEVITTPFTFASTTQAIVRNGLTPVFCDVNPVDFTMDVTKIESLVTPSTCAIMPVHVYGNICDVDSIQEIANRHGLKVIYDAAHTFGIRYKNKGIGSYGDVSCFSFHATKVFNTIEGGSVCFHDVEFGTRLHDLKNFGIHGESDIPEIGTNAKMNEFCAAMGICNLRHVDAEIARRKLAVERYRERLSGVEGLKLSPIQRDVISNYAYFPVVFDPVVFGASRDQVQEHLAEEEIFARKYFYPLTSSFQCYAGKFEIQETPVAMRLSEQVLTLPLFSDLTRDMVDRICDVILSCGKH